MTRKFLVTAALPYSNGRLHVGHIAGAYLPADIYVRYLRAKGDDVRFICGSDDNGVAITLSAQKEGLSVIHVGPLVSPYRYHDYGMAIKPYPKPEEEDADPGIPEKYIIYQKPSPYNASRVTLFLVGTDDEGTELATEILLKCLTFE